MKYLFVFLGVTFFVALTLQACKAETKPAANETGSVEADVESIKAWFDRESAAFRTGDVDAEMALYTDDIVNMPQGEPSIEGLDASRRSSEQFSENYDLTTYSTTLVEVEVHGDWAFARGKYDIEMKPKAEGGSIQHNGKFLNYTGEQFDW